MVAIKTHQADAFLSALDRLPAGRAVLRQRRGPGGRAGGPAGQAPGRARRPAGRDHPPRRCRASRKTPAASFVELQTAPMFGGRKVVRAVAGPARDGGAAEAAGRGRRAAGLPDRRGRQPAPRRCAARAVREVAARPRRSPASPTRRAISKPSCARCSRRGKMQITPEAKRLLLARLGADRALSRAEIDKLALYAHGKSMIEESDVEAAVGDAAELALDRIVMAAASGRGCGGARRVRPQRRRAARARRPSSPRCSAISCACIACAARSTRGRSMDDVVRSLRPPPHFKQTRGARAAVPRLDACPSSTPRSRASPTPPRPRASTPRWRARWRRICCWTRGDRWRGSGKS